MFGDCYSVRDDAAMNSPTKLAAILQEAFFCPHADALLMRVRSGNGAERLTMWCRDCQHHVADEKGFAGKWIAKADPQIAHVPYDSIPFLEQDRFWRRCQGPCRQITECEYHHFAPRKYFADEADNWPTGWLCDSCHDRWHALVTPALCTKYDPAAHCRQLLETLKRDQLHALTRLLVDHFKKVA